MIAIIGNHRSVLAIQCYILSQFVARASALSAAISVMAMCKLLRFLLIGHTHDAIDRLHQLMKQLMHGLPGMRFSSSDLMRVWNWKALEGFDIPPMQGMA